MTPKNFKFDTAFGKFTHRFLQIGNQSGTSREPVGNQSGKFTHHPKSMKNGQKCCFFQCFLHFFFIFAVFLGKNEEKNAKTLQKPAFLTIFQAFGVVRKFSRLVPDWFPTGSRLVPDLQIAVRKFTKGGVKFEVFGCRFVFIIHK